MVARTNLERQLFGDTGLVYPGHPLCIAHLIMHEFASLEAARADDCALRSEVIRGAGGNVRAALDLLRYVRTASPTVAVKYANAYWSECKAESCPETTIAAGQAQADAIQVAFHHKIRAWCDQPAPA